MSTLATNAITDASGGNTTTINGYTPTVSNMAGRNRIINGNFEIWQRGNTSRTFAVSGNYSSDRWCRSGYQDAAHERVAISSPVAGMTSRYALRSSTVTTAEAAGGSRMDVSQKIESVNCYDLAGQYVTFSFWIRFSSATISSSTTAFGNFQSRIQYNTSTTDLGVFGDLGDGTICSTSFANGSLPTTWTKVFKTALVPAGTKNLSVRFQSDNLGNTASAGSEWFEIAEVQIEAGSVATPFENVDYGEMLRRCQRYYYRIDSIGGNKRAIIGIAYSSTELECLWTFQQTMRSSPTVTAPSLGDVLKEGVGWYVPTSASVMSTTPTFANIGAILSSSGFSQGQAGWWGSNSGSLTLTASAEL